MSKKRVMHVQIFFFIYSISISINTYTNIKKNYDFNTRNSCAGTARTQTLKKNYDT